MTTPNTPPEAPHLGAARRNADFDLSKSAPESSLVRDARSGFLECPTQLALRIESS